MTAFRGPELAGWTRAIRRSALEDMLVETARPDVISLALGLPAPDLFPKAAIARSVTTILESNPRALQYGPPVDELRAFVASLMKRRGVQCRPEQIFLTAGAQQGMSLLVRTLLDAGSTVLVEEKCYTGFLQVLVAQGANIATVPTSLESGIDVEAVERALQADPRPSLLYTMSDGANPTGASIPLAARRHLLELACKWGVPILEDDAYGMISYDGRDLPALRSFDSDWVFYVGSFSKTLSPALRTGWVVVPERFVPPLASLKESSDINTATLGQRIVAEFVATEDFEAHLQTLRTEYAQRRDALLAALARQFPSGTRWSTPRAGFFTWVELPDGVNSVRLLEIALERERVAFLPGPAFAAVRCRESDGEPEHRGNAGPLRGDSSSPAGRRLAEMDSALRLNFSFSPVPALEDGVARIARALERLHALTRETSTISGDAP